MGVSVLIAVPHDFLRAGLRTLFEKDAQVDNICEIATSANLANSLGIQAPDMVIIHQSFVADITILPAGRFVIIAPEPDKDIFLASLAHGGRGYILESTSSNVLLVSLLLDRGPFFLDSALLSWLADCISGRDTVPDGHVSPVDSEQLTRRELEVFHLIQNGLSNQAIADQLCISRKTAKKHRENITRKLGKNLY